MRRTSRRRDYRPAGEQLESRALLATFTVVNTQTHGQGSLEWAIEETGTTRGPDTIEFDIPGDGPHDIDVPQFLVIRYKVTIDGYSQPGSERNTSTDPAVNNAQIMVNLINTSQEAPWPCLEIKGLASGTQIRGLGFYNSKSPLAMGVQTTNVDQVAVDGCVFGARGQVSLSRAVDIRGGSHNTIGGGSGTPALQNVMTHYRVGVELNGDAQHDAIVGNLIGGEPMGSGDQQIGVVLSNSAKHNTVIRNVLFKNITAVKYTSKTNVVADNTEVPR
jgi:hypothetical protein